LGGVKPWDLAIAEITITPARRRLVDFSIPYMRVDQGVLLAQTVDPIPRTIDGAPPAPALRPRRLDRRRPRPDDDPADGSHAQ
jgi:Bacterial extracellular solute-binding proteins, family 3